MEHKFRNSKAAGFDSRGFEEPLSPSNIPVLGAAALAKNQLDATGITSVSPNRTST